MQNRVKDVLRSEIRISSSNIFIRYDISEIDVWCLRDKIGNNEMRRRTGLVHAVQKVI